MNEATYMVHLIYIPIFMCKEIDAAIKKRFPKYTNIKDKCMFFLQD